MNECRIDRLYELFTYDPDNGSLKNAVTRGRSRAGDEAGSLQSQGYRSVAFDGHRIKVHRIAFAMTFGRWPDGVLDHINGNVSDNRICNLREASNGENARNAAIQRNNTSGYRGVCYYPKVQKWRARIACDRKHIHLGMFETADDAVAAYKIAAEKYHGQFAFHLNRAN